MIDKKHTLTLTDNASGKSIDLQVEISVISPMIRASFPPPAAAAPLLSLMVTKVCFCTAVILSSN